MSRFKTAVALAIVSLVLAVTLPVLAGDAEKAVKLTGWISDEWCGAKNANADGKACALSCAKKGAALVLYVDGKPYGLSDQKAAADHVGVEVVVTGTLAQDGTIRVTGIEENRKDKKA